MANISKGPQSQSTDHHQMCTVSETSNGSSPVQTLFCLPRMCSSTGSNYRPNTEVQSEIFSTEMAFRSSIRGSAFRPSNGEMGLESLQAFCKPAASVASSNLPHTALQGD